MAEMVAIGATLSVERAASRTHDKCKSEAHAQAEAALAYLLSPAELADFRAHLKKRDFDEEVALTSF